MENLSDALNSLLENPDILKQVQSLSSTIGKAKHEEKDEESNGDNDISSLLSNLISSNSQPSNESENSANTDINPNTLQMITKIMPILSSVKKEDKNTYLLNSLRPFLGSARKKKLDESIKMMQMMKILPLLKDTGILNALF